MTFEEVYYRTLPRLYAFVRSQVSRRETAEEILERVLVKAYRRWGHRRCDDGTVLWIFRTARTTLIDHWRAEGRRERASVPVDEVEDLPAPAHDPEADYASKECHALVLQALADLDDDQQMLIALKFAGERTNREIAPILGISEAAVSMRLLRALRALRDRLRRLGMS